MPINHTEEIKNIFKKVGKEEMKQLAKEAYQEAVKEWLDEKFAQFGKWTFYALGATVVAGVLMLMGWIHGWRPS